MSADAAIVRAAAVQSLSIALLQPEVQQAAAGSPGLANTYEGLWDALSDALLDERPFVVGLAAAAVAQLLTAGDAGSGGEASAFSGTHADGGTSGGSAAITASDGLSPAAFMLTRVADRAAQRLAAALGPVLEMCGQVPAPGQVAVCDMLLSLARRALAHALRAASGLPGAPLPPPGVPVPSPASLVGSVAAYLSTLLQSGDPAARTEACGAVLGLAADLAAAGPAAAGPAAALPQTLVLEAAQALLQLREREFVEAGLPDICEAVVGAVPALLPTARAHVLRSIWPLASRITDLPRRARIFALAWHAAVASEMDYRTAAGASAAAAAAATPLALPPAPSVSASSDPLSMLAAAVGPASGPPEAAGVVTAVPPSRSVAAQLAEPYLEALLAGKAPLVETEGVFEAAQVSASAAAPPPSTSLLSTVTSLTRAAPPPPPGSVPRSESARSAGSSVTSSPGAAAATGAAGGKGGKPEKEKKGGVLGGLFFRGKSKGKAGDATTPDRANAAAETAAAEAAAAAARIEAARGAPASPAPVPSPRGVGSAAAIQGPDGKAAAGLDAGAMAVTRSTPHVTLRHELLQTLLQQLAAHPAATAAAELCAQHAAAARHDRHPPAYSPCPAAGAGGAATTPGQRLLAAAQWVAMASEVLRASAACVGWEPYVLPAITSQPSVSAAGRAPIDFNVLTADLWLATLQAACQAARSVQASLRRGLTEAAEAVAAAAAAGAAQQLSYLGMGYGVPYGMAPAGGGPGGVQGQGQQSPEAAAEAHCRALLTYVDERAGVLQSLMLKLLSSWSGLSAAARPRVAWVCAHCLALPGHWDDSWAALAGTLEWLLLRGTDTLAAARRADMMGSALAGSLFKAGRQAWTDPNRPFLFDIAAASALCESPEHEAAQLLAALAGLQHAAGRLTNAVAEAAAAGSAAAAHGQAVSVAKRLEALLRGFIATEAAAAPHVRDWVKRIMRSLAAVIAYTPPANLPPTVAALGLIAKKAHEADGNAAAAPADDDSSSDASSVYNPDEGQPELPPALAAAAAAAVAAAAAAASGQAQEPAAQEEHGAAAPAAPAAAAPAQADGAAGGAVAGAEGGAAHEEAGRPRAHSAGLSSSYLVHSAATAVPMWGYPFAPLSSFALQNSKRARRHRALLRHLTTAAAAATAPRPALAAALAPLTPPEAAPSPPSSGPALSCRGQYRLDSEAFWASLQPGRSPWQELTGPADPLLLRACCVRPGAGRADPTVVTVLLSAVNRLPVELGDVIMTLKAGGHLLPTARRAATWELPRLAPHDRANTSFKFKLLGYGDLSLHVRLQLCPGPPRTDAAPLQLNCVPLELPAATLLRPPPAPLPAAEFFRAWGALPARAELSGVCVWPGPEGGALLLSALLRAPLGCAALSHLPALAGFSAAFSAVTALDDSLAVLVNTQMMPPAAPGGSAECFCSFSIRSSSPDLILGLQAGAAAWLASITAGTAVLGVAARPTHPSPAAKPPLHPRVAALLQSYAASAASLAAAAGSGAAAGGGLTSFSSFGLPADGPAAAGAGAGAGGGGDRPVGRGPGGREASSAWLKSAALAEWQRLNSMPVV